MAVVASKTLDTTTGAPAFAAVGWHTDVMDLLAEVQARLGRINIELADSADRARVAFVSIEPDPDFDGEWLLVTTWQLPHLVGSDGWPLSQLDTYCDLVGERLRDLGSTECLFRTAEELDAEGAPSGAALQVA